MSRVCGCIGCANDAAVVVYHELHGERTVCEDCVNGYEVVRNV